MDDDKSEKSNQGTSIEQTKMKSKINSPRLSFTHHLLGHPCLVLPNVGTFCLAVYHEIRCERCHKCLAKPSVRGVAGEIKCPRCGHINKF